MDEKHKIPMCNSPFMRYAGDAGELEEFSCAVGDFQCRVSDFEQVRS